jgi:hypothetical protein
MSLNQQGGKLLVKGGKLQTDCACCGDWYCHADGCLNLFAGGTVYKFQGREVPFTSNHSFESTTGGVTEKWYWGFTVDGSVYERTETHPTLGTVFLNLMVQRVPFSFCKFYLKFSAEVRSTAIAGYQNYLWTPIFHADDYELGESVVDSVNNATVSSRPRALSDGKTEVRFTNPAGSPQWSELSEPSFSVEMTFGSIVDARCV